MKQCSICLQNVDETNLHNNSTEIPNNDNYSINHVSCIEREGMSEDEFTAWYEQADETEVNQGWIVTYPEQ